MLKRADARLRANKVAEHGCRGEQPANAWRIIARVEQKDKFDWDETTAHRIWCYVLETERADVAVVQDALNLIEIKEHVVYNIDALVPQVMEDAESEAEHRGDFGRLVEPISDVPVPLVVKETLGDTLIIPQERILERVGGQMVVVPVPNAILEVVKQVQQECIQQRTIEEMVDVTTLEDRPCSRNKERRLLK